MFYSELLLIFDSEDCIIGACVGPPDVAEWPDVHRAVFEKVNAEREQATFAKEERKHRRGRFPAINVGISMGTGPSHPGVLELGSHSDMAERLVADPNIIRMANHASGTRCSPPAVFAAQLTLLLFSPRSFVQCLCPKSCCILQEELEHSSG